MSAAEVAHGQAVGLVHDDSDEFDRYPLVQRRIPAGDWETRDMGARHATPWDALGVM